MKRLMFLALSAALVASPVQAKSKAAATAKPKAAPAELKWMDGPPGLPAGATFAVLSGDPGKVGKFTVQIKMPPNYQVPAHWHPSDEHLTLVSGKLSYGMSDRLDRAGAKPLAEGASVTMKAKEHHWVLTGDGATVQVSAMGPFQITYVDPSSDPRGAAKKP